jgi:Family of unknown function (DUF5335)
MITRKLEPPTWKDYFDRASRSLAGGRAAIEVLGDDLGDQELAEMTLLGMSYDPHDRALTIAGESLDHRISDPQEIYVEEELGNLSCLEVLDLEGHKQIIKIEPAPMLPP